MTVSLPRIALNQEKNSKDRLVRTIREIGNFFDPDK
jgi:hypothetical protein